MTNRLKCPECGNDELKQERLTTFQEPVAVGVSSTGEIDDEYKKDRECGCKESAQAYECEQCGWQVIDEDGDPVTEFSDNVSKTD